MMGEVKRKVRLQIPVDREIARRVAGLAKILRRSKSQTAAFLLEEAVEAETNLKYWIATRVTSALKLALTGPSKRSGQLEYVQVFVSQELSSRIDLLAGKLHSTPGQMASMLLEDGTEDNDWVAKTFALPAIKVKQMLIDAKKDRAPKSGSRSAGDLRSVKEAPCLA